MSVKTARPKSPKPVRTGADSFRLIFENHPLPMWVYDLKTLVFLGGVINPVRRRE